MDLRGHGKSFTENDMDLSIETLCNDVLAVLETMYGDSPPAVVLVGHSMGGSVAVHVAAKKVISKLAGVIIVDVVEVEWSVKGGSLRNIESARLSVPSTLIYDDSKKCYTYRTKLEETERYWRGWPTNLFFSGDVTPHNFACSMAIMYEGLSDLFLSSPAPKLLLLAGTDRLDKSLTIGQMQGKFQMVVVRHTGHAIQEDVPDEFASLLLNFISRNRIGPNGVEDSPEPRPFPQTSAAKQQHNTNTLYQALVGKSKNRPQTSQQRLNNEKCNRNVEAAEFRLAWQLIFVVTQSTTNFLYVTRYSPLAADNIK
ncbi:hypothetical protein IFM89_037021 [Coptis chinensis]|uniref:protein phosphatase methylesterase-1 n=1 Tax=Coptis chinensis TaxID=261450 RepID=A0A835HPW7_9MAGN|nr:hypothetical protein IFM89_037021 [Coptis chinensis]